MSTLGTKKIDLSSALNVGIFYQDIDEPGGYSRDILRLYHELEQRKGKVYKLKNFTALVKTARKLDVVHVFGVFKISSVFACLYCRLMKTPYVVTTFSHLMPYAMTKGFRKKKFFLDTLGRYLLNNANKIHAFTIYEEMELRNLGIKAPIEKITLGVYPEDVGTKSKPIDTKVVSKYSPYIIFLGRLDIFQKGLDILIDGFVKYASQNSKYQLVICGQDWQGGDEFIKLKLAELENHDRISFLGAVSEEEKDVLIEMAEALIYPSRFDGPPRPLRFALSKNKKVLASKQSNIADNLEDKGWGLLFDANPLAISEVLLKFEKKKNWPNYRDPNLTLAWDTVANEYVSLYKSVVKE